MAASDQDLPVDPNGQEINIPFPAVDYEEYYNPLDYAVIVPLSAGLIVFDIALIILVVASNSFMIYFICGQKKSRTTHNVTIVCIAVCDILVATVVMPFYLVLASDTSVSADSATPFMCKLSRYLGWWFKTVTVYSTMAMVVNRYLKLTDPRGQSFLTGRCMFYLSFVWFSAAAYNIWKIVLNENLIIPLAPADHRNLSVARCTASDYYPKLRTGFLVADFSVIYLGPMVLCFIMFIRMVNRLCQTSAPHDQVKAKNRIAMSAMFASLWFLCQLPLQIAESCFYYNREVTLYDINIFNLLQSLSLVQGLLNVLAFVACSKEFHKAWRESCCCATVPCCCCDPPEEAPTDSRRGTHVLLRSNSAENVIEALTMS